MGVGYNPAIRTWRMPFGFPLLVAHSLKSFASKFWRYILDSESCFETRCFFFAGRGLTEQRKKKWSFYLPRVGGGSIVLTLPLFFACIFGCDPRHSNPRPSTSDFNCISAFGSGQIIARSCNNADLEVRPWNAWTEMENSRKPEEAKGKHWRDEKKIRRTDPATGKI